MTAQQQNSTGGSFSAWFQEADKSARAGRDPLAATSSGASSGSAVDYVSGWLKGWTQADLANQSDDLEAGGLLSRPSASGLAAESGDEYALSRTERFRYVECAVSWTVFCEANKTNVDGLSLC